MSREWRKDDVAVAKWCRLCSFIHGMLWEQAEIEASELMEVVATIAMNYSHDRLLGLVEKLRVAIGEPTWGQDVLPQLEDFEEYALVCMSGE